MWPELIPLICLINPILLALHFMQTAVTRMKLPQLLTKPLASAYCCAPKWLSSDKATNVKWMDQQRKAFFLLQYQRALILSNPEVYFLHINRICWERKDKCVSTGERKCNKTENRAWNSQLTLWFTAEVVQYIYRMYRLKWNPNTKHILRYRLESEAVSKPPRDTRAHCPPVIRLLLSQAAQKFCRCEHGVFTRRTCDQPLRLLYIKTADAHETSINAHPDKEVPNETTHRLVTKFLVFEIRQTL
jgi:hypothetical protein